MNLLPVTSCMKKRLTHFWSKSGVTVVGWWIIVCILIGWLRSTHSTYLIAATVYDILLTPSILIPDIPTFCHMQGSLLASVTDVLNLPFSIVGQRATASISSWCPRSTLLRLSVGTTFFCGVWLSISTKIMWLGLRQNWWRLVSKGTQTPVSWIKLFCLTLYQTSTPGTTLQIL